MADKTNDTLQTLLTEQKKIKTDISEMKTDIVTLKTDVVELKEGQQRLELFLVNMENRIMPKINAMYENSISSKQQIALVKETQDKHADKIDNHELRILKLEQSKQ